MQLSAGYILMPIMAILLVTAQAVWGYAIKNQRILEAPTPWQLIINIATSPCIWLGAFIYVCATGIYFLLLSKNNFYIVQVGMTSITIVFSTLLAVYFFHEKISAINLAGIFLVMVGLALLLKN